MQAGQIQTVALSAEPPAGSLLRSIVHTEIVPTGPCSGAHLDDRQMETQAHADSAKDTDGLQLPSKPAFRSAQVSSAPHLHALSA